ncbi:hypothetical protein [Streptomyces longisporoflavus]|uniref:hypothetical protein n=1 Tax=Streptomyces longisporoflavus TaxID=28044 RepID=UPI00167C6683|nr:hypothetical protein [Streptomyces longisporoflavus]
MGRQPDSWFTARHERPAARELDDERYYAAFCAYAAELGDYPNARQFGLYLLDVYGVIGRGGGPLSEQALDPLLPGLRQRYQQDVESAADVEPDARGAGYRRCLGAGRRSTRPAGRSRARSAGARSLRFAGGAAARPGRRPAPGRT